MEKLVEKALEGDPRSMARLISMVESESPFAENLMKAVYPYSGKAHIIGVTGSPGSGKSTLLDKLIGELKKKGKTVGVIAVDPSSPFSGGAVLGDRLRMQGHSLDRDVFIRSMGTRGSLGGLSRATYEAALILDACGKDVVLIETVGVGQSEIDIVKIADTVCLVLVPGMGDDIQVMKAGIMEIADIFVVNKSDKEGAERVATEVNMMLDLLPDRTWRPPVVSTVAERGEGIDALCGKIEEHRNHLKETDEGRKRKYYRLEVEVEEILSREIARIVERAWEEERTTELLEKLADRKIDPYTVAGSLIDRVLGRD
ncbi:MAG TPA: methylmalonyl Co-A mutase-associated GTPase MeaB [Synergistaceae bacterium]|jgi:LAO/AO transport system kinase|nr:MAG: LAO/AO transport system ATPase [Synergistales bacterium 53_16]KUL03898.1 MAG: LAO/AO transport system ATPase [Synergistales bacterium 54_9]MDK2845809.1 GTPase [Synergistales bacterium]HAA47942.1 methylmalonyl Co-A mutase-associated GTPase MeaB [Synergistaceae bacterium]MDN5336604.1 GTPase [Synergistales bacterium]